MVLRGRLLTGVKAFYSEVSVCVRMDGELYECFPIGVEIIN